MKCFEVLGIEPTKDLNAIKMAYASLLPKFSPEVDPDGFQGLREAYNEANQYAKEGEKKKELSPEEEFMEEFQACYENYSRRIDPEEWNRLLENNVCYAIDSAEEIHDRVLYFIMSNYYFPTNIWNLLNDRFSWSENRNELIKKYPENFIDYVISRINDESKIYYEELVDAKDNRQDEFLRIFGTIIQKIKDCNYYESEKEMNILKEICPDHPDILMVESTFAIEMGDVELAIRKIDQAIELKKEDLDYYAYRGDIYMRVGELEKACEDYEKSISLSEEAYNVMFSLIKCYIARGRADLAEEYADVLDENIYYNPNVSMVVRQVYEFRCHEVGKEFEKDPENQKIKESYAKLLFFIDERDKAYKLYEELINEGVIFNEKASYYYALLLCHMNKLDELLEACNQAIEKYGESSLYGSKLWSLKGWCLGEEDKSEEAIECYDQALRLNPKEVSTMSNKSYELNKLGRYEEAIAMADQAIQLKPSSARAYKNKAKALLELEMYQEALYMCNRSIEIYPFQEEPYETKMLVYLRVGYHNEALDVFKAAESYEVTSHKLYAYKGDVLWSKKMHEEAIEYFNKAIDEKPEEASYYSDKASILYDMEKYREAIVEYNKAIKRAPKDGKAHFYKALCYLEAGEQDQAIQIINNYIQNNNTHLDRFYGLLGDIYRVADKAIKSIHYYKKALQLVPEEPSYLLNLGRVYGSLGQYEDAISIYHKKLQLDDSDIRAYTQLTFCLYQVERFEECISYCDKGLEIDSNEVYLYDNKADALHRLGRYTEALAICERGLALSPTEQDLIFTKVKIFKIQEKLKEALILIEQILDIDSNSYVARQAKEYRDSIKKELAKEQGILKRLFKK